MKKTLTVNLGGTVFHIDEDAYQLLDKYLTNLRIHFSKEDGSEEIMSDFELRISEILSERVRLGNDVITIEHVEGVIKRMGKVEELFDEEPAKDSAGQKTYESFKNRATSIKRLFRNPDDKMLGGVASGFAAYIDCDPTPVRLILFASIFLFGAIIPIYIILWLIIPLASTAEQKLQMRGEAVSVENIGKTVTDGFDKITNNVNDYVNSGKPRSLAHKIGDVLVTLLGIFLKVMMVLLAVILFPPLLIALFVMIVVIIAVVFGGGVGLLYHLTPFADWNLISVLPESILVWGSISTILVIGIPIVSVIYAISSQIFKFKPVSSTVKWTLVILWIVALIASGVLAVRYGAPVWGNWHNVDWHYSSLSTTLTDFFGLL